jgi:hypothetical protein
MPSPRELTPGRIAAAFLVAASADAIQLPLNAVALTGFLAVPSELFDLVVDAVTCVAVSLLLGGFHWVLAPTFLIEAVPVLDAIPTWTASVAALVWIRKKQAARASAGTTAGDALVLTLASSDARTIVPGSVALLPREELAP